MQGPFSLEMNLATIGQYQIRYLVTKDGGGPGGFSEKRQAALEAGIEILVIERPEEAVEGVDFASVMEMCIALLKSGDAK